MSTLSNLLFRANISALNDVPDVQIAQVVLDSRASVAGGLFCAIQGTVVDGNAHADQALERGCVAVLTDRVDCAHLPQRVLVPSVPEAIGVLCRTLLGEPQAGMKVFAVTGTNGKTSSVFLAEAMLREAGWLPALSSTVVVRGPDFSEVASMTTPDAVHLWDFVARAQASGARSLAMEVSSHALSQNRIGGLLADVAVFTNLTRDHLDYHGSMGEYFAAKSLLFTRHLKENGVAVINVDDEHGRVLRSQLGSRARTFGSAKYQPDWELSNFTCTLDGNRFSLTSGSQTLVLESPLVGEVFAWNLAGVAVAALEMGIPADVVVRAARQVTVPGRCQVVRRGDYRAVVDYAHTPDALERLLTGLRPMVAGQLRVVFGCGGDRDKGKRPLMGDIASRLADVAYLTSDNPRTEDPEAILDDVQSGMDETRTVRMADRRGAICAAVQSMHPNDLVVVAGKGHEDYQILGTQKHHFDDREEVARALALREGKTVEGRA